MENQTLIYIPDISGFTEFVNTTEIEHSQHIISELLEIIIAANKLNFSISEIEGDAVLFYKKEDIPSPQDLIEQSKEMFLQFHSHLMDIEKNNVCQCGACRSASNLSLKFISHLGDLKEVNVDRFNKLIGSDLILAHRLLKNSIISNEYLLFSDPYFNNFAVDKNKLDDWMVFESRDEEIEKFGNISLQYIDFKPLLDHLPKFIKDQQPITYTRKPDISISINAPLLLVHEALTDANAKYDFVPGIKKIITDDKINRVNSSHTCVFDNFEIHFVSKNNSTDKDKITYTEEAQLPQGFKFITDYRLVEKERITELSIYIIKSKISDNNNESFLKKIKDSFFFKFIIRNNKKGIKHFKEYCERKHLEADKS